VPPSRIVTMVLLGEDGMVLGSLPPFEAATPWWQDIGPVVDGVRERFGLDVTVLRLLGADRAHPPGGAVTYLAEPGAGPSGHVPAPGPDFRDLAPWAGDLPDDPLRQAWARPGGPAADLAWADGVLTGLGRPRVAPAQQVRTWNLSSLWRLPTAGSAAWLKVVPPFFAQEGALLDALAGGPVVVPRVLGRDGPRSLLDEVPGEDRYDAPIDERLAMVDGLVRLQTAWSSRTAELFGLGLPDWRGVALTQAIAAVVERSGDSLETRDRATLEAFVAELPARFDALGACGLPDTLVHGDFHPGNVRGDGMSMTLIDWGDAGVGHPLLDQPALLAVTPEPWAAAAVASRWADAWRSAVPGSQPERAAALLAPVAAARLAVIYRRFLDGIEASEHPYHLADVPAWLRRTAAILETEPVRDWAR
jgi:aminoglycoside/choline kinase family phosphotransferase